MIRLGLWRALMLFGILQMLGNLGFWWLALHGRDALPGLVDPGVRLGLRQARRADAGRRRPADGDRQREHHQRHGHGGVRRVPDEPVQPALQRDPVRAAAARSRRSAGSGSGRSPACSRSRSAGRRSSSSRSSRRCRRLCCSAARVLRRPSRYAGRAIADDGHSTGWPCRDPRLRHACVASALVPAAAAAPCRAGAASLAFAGARRRGAALRAAPVLAREGVDVGPPSTFAKLVSAEQIERPRRAAVPSAAAAGRAAARARAGRAIRSCVRLRASPQRIIPFTLRVEPARARSGAGRST